MPSSANKPAGRSGLTLVELLITIAVSAIIVGLTFTGLRTEQQRTAAKEATERLQIDLLALQNKIQSGIALTTRYCTRGGGNYSLLGRYCTSDTICDTNPGQPGTIQGRCVAGPPSGFGISMTSAATSYSVFADMPLGTTAANGIRLIDATYTNSYDQSITANKTLGQNIRIVRLKTNGSANASRVDISFNGINGRIIIYDATLGSCGTACTTATIILQQTVTGVCYAITVDKASQIVSKRQFSSTCQ